MWTNDGIHLYEGDCIPGHRAATEAEVAAWLSAKEPSARDTILADIAELLAQAKLLPGQEWLLDVAMASMISAGATMGLTEPQLYAANPGYRTAKDLAARVAAKVALL